ncbi:hypothetical protein ColTof4_13603 [Colletotrichum tofieldiae]|nr:hypothetical protein ColTof3_14555 [Colletotrichum tofieldiae]GKT81180.1 hypothetical protein ColTof4_13603 [Colletotrichum tofieldiae]GKT97307.1 hypothetical protein Ct61P_15157 [Colletotrichum tofieldiae]
MFPIRVPALNDTKRARLDSAASRSTAGALADPEDNGIPFDGRFYDDDETRARKCASSSRGWAHSYDKMSLEVQAWVDESKHACDEAALRNFLSAQKRRLNAVLVDLQGLSDNARHAGGRSCHEGTALGCSVATRVLDETTSLRHMVKQLELAHKADQKIGGEGWTKDVGDAGAMFDGWAEERANRCTATRAEWALRELYRCVAALGRVPSTAFDRIKLDATLPLAVPPVGEDGMTDDIRALELSLETLSQACVFIDEASAPPKRARHALSTANTYNAWIS